MIVNKFGPILAPRSARLEEMRNQFDGSRLRSAATVTPADFPLLAQARPGTAVRFVEEPWT